MSEEKLTDLNPYLVQGRANLGALLDDTKNLCQLLRMHMDNGGSLDESELTEELLQRAVIILTSIPSYSIMELLHEQS